MTDKKMVQACAAQIFPPTRSPIGPLPPLPPLLLKLTEQPARGWETVLAPLVAGQWGCNPKAWAHRLAFRFFGERGRNTSLGRCRGKPQLCGRQSMDIFHFVTDAIGERLGFKSGKDGGAEKVLAIVARRTAR